MAQAPQKDIQAIIDSAAAQEGVDAELLRKIGGSESSLKATAKNPKSTAKGLFQFVDKTWAEMGGKPGEQYIPEKNAQLGAKYVKKNQQALAEVLGRDPSYGEVYAAHVFGPTGAKALLTKADPNAPIEQSLAMFESPKRVQKVLKQNPNLQGKTTAQVLADLDAKMGSKKPSATVQEPTAPAKPERSWFRSPVPKFIRSEAPNLGTGYNAALALMGMSDDEVEKAKETVAQNEEDNAIADFGQAKQMLAGLQAPNAFANRQPMRMMARGGAVNRAAPQQQQEQSSGGFYVPVQRNIYRPEDKKYLDEQLAAWNKYNEEANAYNKKLAEYQGSAPVKEYGSAVEAYNAKVKEYQDTQWTPYKAAVDEYNAKLAKFNESPEFKNYQQQVDAYNSQLAQYQKDVYDPYKAQVDAYNTGLEQFKASDSYKNYISAAESYNKSVDAYNAAPTRVVAEQVYYGKAPGGPGYLGNRYVYYRASGPGQERAWQPNYEFINTNPAVPYFGNVVTKDVAKPGAFTMTAPTYNATVPTAPTPFNTPKPDEVKFGEVAPTKPADFTMAPPTAPAGFSVPLPNQPGESIETVMARRTKAEQIAAKDAEQRGIAIQAANNPNQFNLSGFGSAGINQPTIALMAEGGEVTPEPEKGLAKAMLKEVGRSTQYAPADIVGSPVDLINLGLKGVDAMAGTKLAQELPVGGAEWIIKKANEYGLMDKPTGSTTENLTRMAMGVASPTAGPRAVAGAAKAVKGTAKAALEDLAMAGTGQGGSPIAQKFAAATGIEPKFASRPKGGVTLGASSAADVPLTRIDETIKQNLENIDTSTEQGQAVANFLDKKMRNFYQNQYGTADDPLFKAILQNRVQPSLSASPAIVDAARAGDPEALKKLRQAYDASTNIQVYGSKAVLKEQGKSILDLEDQTRKLIKQQSPNEDTLMVLGEKLGPEELKAYPNIYGPKGFKDIVSEGEAGKLLRLLNQTDLQPHVRQAVAKGEPIYGMTGGPSRMLPIGEMKDYLFTRTPAEIKNMGVVDVAVKAKEWHRKMAEARKNPEKFGRKELFSGTEPVLPLEKGTWVDVKTPDALSLEGNIMGHCVGGSNYCNAVAKDTTKIISLRDKKGLPHVTIQLEKTPEGFTRVAQIKGTANNSPEKYFGEINAFLDDYSAKLGKNLTITERPSFVPPQWRDK